MSQFMHKQSRVPPGFRFHPTDEELVGYYLHKKVAARRIDLDVIREIDLYKMEPWDLEDKCRIGSAEQNEWYFFSHKDKKYPTGTRTNRATTAGFWKATGRDKTIHTKFPFLGMRKTLVFYKGRAPNGQKTDWIMHEYRIEDESPTNNCNEEGWVVCRVFKKKINPKGYSTNSSRNDASSPPTGYDEQASLLQEFSLPASFMTATASSSTLNVAQPFMCKQEAVARTTDEVPGFSFSRLPQLESPKMTAGSCTTSTAAFNSIKGCGYNVDNHNNVILRNSYPPTFSMDAEFDRAGIPNMISSSSMGNPACGSLEDQVTDWRMVDKLAASQFSSEQALKELGYNQESEEYVGDVALLLRLSKQDNIDHGEFWSFGREQTSL